MAKYDLLIVGAGLYGAMAAYVATSRGKKVLVIDKNGFVGGFCHSERHHGIDVHMFGAHIFRTSSKNVWDFVNGIDEFVPFVNSPLALYKGEAYNLPFNMNTFHQLWDVVTPEEAASELERRRLDFEKPYKNLEEFVLATVGEEIYEKFIKHYTEKQWGRKCTDLPASVMSRIPIRLTYDNNYYRETYQGVPKNGYDFFIRNLLAWSDLQLEVDWFDERTALEGMAESILFTGPIDKFFDYRFGKLEYRSVRFEHTYFDYCDNLQGVAVVNHTDELRAYTRTIEHKHFLKTECNGTFVSYEFPCLPSEDVDPSYPIPNKENNERYKRYKSLADGTKVKFGGRLGEYRYYSMNDIVEKFICK